MFCAPGIIFGGPESVGSRFHVLPSRTPFHWYRRRQVRFHVLRARNHFRRYQVRQVPFSCFARQDSFSAVPRALGPVFMFCARGRVFGGMRRVSFSYFVLPDSFSTVPRASGPVFMFCASEVVFGGAECVGSRFHVFRARTHFRRYRGRRVPFSCFARPDSFSAVPRASGPFFMLCAPELIFDGTDGIGSRFHVLCSRTHFRRYRGHQVPFSCFVLSDSFSALPRASRLVFMFCAPGLVFGGAECVGSRFHVLPARTRFRRCRVRRVPFSCFACPESCSAVLSASGPIFKFCAPGLIFGGVECVGPRFTILCPRTHFRRCRVRRVPFSCFARPESFSAVSRASGPVFMFCASGVVFGSTECVGSRFHVLRSQTPFRRYRGRRVPFSCFALPDSFSTVPRASVPFF
jgi:hypothetical protein